MRKPLPVLAQNSTSHLRISACCSNMLLTFINDLGQSTVVEIDPNMELENVMALLEAEVRIIPWIGCV